jgi:hypothetical protein
MQLKSAVDRRSVHINKLEKRINEIVDHIYKDFSRSVGVANIREYEENQLKAAQDMAEERLSLSSQLSKLKYQYVFFFFSPSVNSSALLIGNTILIYIYRRVVYIMQECLHAGLCVCIYVGIHVYTCIF